MKPLYLKILLFDPIVPPNAAKDQREFPIFDSIEVEIVRIQWWNPAVGFDSLRLTPDQATGIFIAENPAYKPSRHHFIPLSPLASRSSTKPLASSTSPTALFTRLVLALRLR